MNDTRHFAAQMGGRYIYIWIIRGLAVLVLSVFMYVCMFGIEYLHFEYGYGVSLAGRP